MRIKLKMFYSILKLFSLTFVIRLSASQTIDCFVDGVCEGGTTVALQPAQDVESCLTFCKNTTECNYFSYQTSTKICIAYKDCDNLSAASCPDCTSGHANCSHRFCFLPGQCDGQFVNVVFTENEFVCREECLEASNCQYF